MVAGPPEAPIVQLWPFASQPMPGQKRTPAIPVSGMSYSMKLPSAPSRKRLGLVSDPPPVPFRYWIHIGWPQPLMTLRRLWVQPTQPGAGVGVVPVVAVARGRTVDVAVARGGLVGVAVALPPVTVRLSTLGPFGSSVARMRTEPAGRLTLCERTVQVVQPVTGKDKLETTVAPFTWTDIGRSPVPPFA
jgi:hypothetical protein